MDIRRPIDLDLTLDPDREPIAGILDDHVGPPVEFNGVLDLLALLDEVRGRSGSAT